MFNNNQLYEVKHPLYKFLDHLESRLVTIFPRKNFYMNELIPLWLFCR